MAPQAREVNFDGIVGSSHNYGGLSPGNLASMAHGSEVSHPREAALEGLRKMWLLFGMGVPQAVVPPQERPDLETLRRLGFTGGEGEVLERARREDPRLLAACWSASSMWMANAATLSPSADAADGKVHITPANLAGQFHRSLEPEGTARVLKALFPDGEVFVHHPPLPAGLYFRDEGAANHTRLCVSYGGPGVEIFVYGARAEDPPGRGPSRHPARQTHEASLAVARMHRLEPGRVVFARQNPEAVDAGVFHNDVIAVGNENVFLYHAQAFADPRGPLEEVRQKFAGCCGGEPALIGIPPGRLSLPEAVETYLFNSQLVTLPGGSMCLVAPTECEESERARGLLEEIVQGDSPIREVRFAEVRQSMRNGGGPACLRLRAALTEEEIRKVHAPAFLTEALYAQLTAWVGRHYRERLQPADLADPALLEESRRALDELTQILRLGSLYRFQRAGA